MSRTDELKAAGAVARTREVSGDASAEPAPYVKWGDEYAWVEGQAMELWDSPKGYGESVAMTLTSCSDNLEGKLGTEIVAISAGQRANVGLGSATLKGTITAADVAQDKHFHIAFIRWQEPVDRNRYRVFAVLEVAAPDAEEQGIVALKVPAVAPEADDALPF
jgi:hypothetical protein